MKIYTSENNWYQWKYDNDMFGRRANRDQTLHTMYTRSNIVVNNFKEEMLLAAKSTMDHYARLRPCVFFSGGSESDLVLRAYKDIGSNPIAYIIRYENDLNIHDVSYAITICLMLNVEYKLIDFQLFKFYKNDAELISEIAQIDRPRALPHLKFLDFVEDTEFAVYGIGDPRWARSHDDYTKSASWILIDQEHDTGWDKYLVHKGIPAIAQWFKWTPGLVLSYTRLNWFQNLLSDQYYGKLGVTSTKLIGYREAYSNLLDRKKLTGFERIDDLASEFEEFLSKKYNGLIHRGTVERTLDELWIEITGHQYNDQNKCQHKMK
jgi:hypothetical protein